MTKTIINNTNRDTRIVPFKEIEDGHAFLYYNSLYYKILYKYVENGGIIKFKYFAITPGFYAVVILQDDTLVIPVEEVSITYKI